jgi:chromosomal replication initiator protein
MNAAPLTPVRSSDSRANEPATWGGFVTLAENRSVLDAVQSLSKALLAGRRPPVNLLLVHGSTGLGKTHLAEELLRRLSDADEMITARIAAVGDLARSFPGLTDPDLTACDLLVLEDVQLLPARDADAFCELLDRRLSRRQAVVATANVGPAALRHLPRKLTSRLAAGLVVQLEPLSAASRRAILKHAAQLRRLALTPAALDWLAESAGGGGVRLLLGLLGSVAQGAKAFSASLDRRDVQGLLSASGLPVSSRRDVSRIIKQVAAAYGVTARELLGPSRLRRVMVPRQVAMYLARQLSGLSLPRLGAAFGGRDHTTVLHACRKVEADAVNDAFLASMVRQLRAELA